MDNIFCEYIDEENLKGIKKYLDRKIYDIDELLHSDYTPLFYACQKGKLEVVKFLLKRGANVNYALDDCRSPIEIVCYGYNSKKSEILNLLVQSGAEYNKEELLELCNPKFKREIEEILDGVCLKPARP